MLRPVASALLAGPFAGPPTRAAAASLPDGRVVAVVGGWDDHVHVIDVSTGIRLSPEDGFPVGPMLDMAVLTVPGQGLAVVTGTWDGTVRLWDLLTGEPLPSALTGRVDQFVALTVLTLPGDRAILVCGDLDGTVVGWDAATGEPFGEPLAKPGECATTLAAAHIVSSGQTHSSGQTVSSGRTVIATGDQSGTLCLWDLDNGVTTAVVTDAHPGGVQATAIVEVPRGQTAIDCPAVVVTAGKDGMLRRWNIDTGRPFGEPIQAHSRPANALATAELPDGRMIAVTGGWDHLVRAWDLEAGVPVCPPLDGHTDGVNSLAAVTVSGVGVVAVSTSWDYTARVWRIPPPW